MSLHGNRVPAASPECSGVSPPWLLGGGAAETAEAARLKSEIANHPLYGRLLSEHVGCLRAATPIDQLPNIDEQIAVSHRVAARYSVAAAGVDFLENEDLDQFMTQYIFLLCSFREQLEQHVHVHAYEAIRACWELERSLQSLTGVITGQGTSATMSDEDEDLDNSETNINEDSFDTSDSMGFGPLIPTEKERTLMEQVRQELKHELKQDYKGKLVDIREEILRKRRAGKLPGDTTSLLKEWWRTHSRWPYPTEDDKARLVRETGLQLKQINNWFINQRKRNWNTNPTSPPLLKSKRQR